MTTRTRTLFVAILLSVLAGWLGAAPARADDWVVRQSAQSVEETVQRLERAIERSGSLVLAVFDHKAAAEEVGYELGPATVVFFAKPKNSSPLIAANRRAAIDMPQKFLVWEEDDTTYVGFIAPSSLAARYGFDAGNGDLESMRSAMEALLAASVSRPERRAGGAP